MLSFHTATFLTLVRAFQRNSYLQIDSKANELVRHAFNKLK